MVTGEVGDQIGPSVGVQADGAVSADRCCHEVGRDQVRRRVEAGCHRLRGATRIRRDVSVLVAVDRRDVQVDRLGVCRHERACESGELDLDGLASGWLGAGVSELAGCFRRAGLEDTLRVDRDELGCTRCPTRSVVHVADVRQCEVRERRSEGMVVTIDSIDAEQGRDKLAGHCCAGDGLDLDVDDIVGETTTVREALDITSEDAHPVRIGRHRYRHVQAEHLRRCGGHGCSCGATT